MKRNISPKDNYNSNNKKSKPSYLNSKVTKVIKAPIQKSNSVNPSKIIQTKSKSTKEMTDKLFFNQKEEIKQENTTQNLNIKKYNKPSLKYSNIKTADPFAETKKNKT